MEDVVSAFGRQYTDASEVTDKATNSHTYKCTLETVEIVLRVHESGC